ncbi:hypothetical protein T492DRAFT_854036 [Pavlovales sp. CCMP2436]|nr:hypothetical protein T492DRAFT_854036 [Pavlovales sp. CCMP2436]
MGSDGAEDGFEGGGGGCGTRNIKCVEQERFDGTTTPAEMKSFAGSLRGFDFGLKCGGQHDATVARCLGCISYKNCGAGVRYSREAVGSDWVFSVRLEPHVLTTRVKYEGKGLGAMFRGEIYATLQQFVINSGLGANNIGNMTPSRAITFVKTINGTLFGDEEMVYVGKELSKALSRASRLGLRGAAAQDLAQRVL